MASKKALTLTIVMLLISLLSSIAGIYIQKHKKVDQHIKTIVEEVAEILPIEYESNNGILIDSTLISIISDSPKYSFSGDFDTFNENFKYYGKKALGLPVKKHNIAIEGTSKKSLRVIQSEDVLFKSAVFEISDIEFDVIDEELCGVWVKHKDVKTNKVIIIVPGHPSKSNPLEDLIDISSYQKGIAMELAAEGYSVFCPGLRGFNTSELESHDFNSIAAMKGYSWYGYLTSDALILREIIHKKFNIDKETIGFMGLSTGGAVSLFAAALDETVPFAIVAGFFGSFGYNFVEEVHSRSGNIPNILKYFEMRDYAIAVAPRNLAIINGEFDTFSSSHAFEQFEIVQHAYNSINAQENISFYAPENTGHEYDIDLIIDILEEIAP